MFSPMSYLRVYLHNEALSTESTSSLAHLYLTRLHTASILRKLRRSNSKYNNSSTKVMYVKS